MAENPFPFRDKLGIHPAPPPGRKAGRRCFWPTISPARQP